MRRTPLILLVLLGLAAAGGAAAWWTLRPAAGGEGLTEVRSEPIRRGRLVDTVSAPGTARPRRKVEVSARVSARVRALPFREGDRVATGDVLVELDDVDLRAARDAAATRRDGLTASVAVEEARLAGLEAAVESAGAAAEQARRDLERQRSLREAGDVSDGVLEEAQRSATAATAAAARDAAALEAARLNLEVTRFQIQTAEAELRRAEDALANATIRSPMDGVVTLVNVEVGEVAVVGTMNNAGTVLLEVADLSALVVDADVDESAVSRVAAGQPAVVRMAAFPDRSFPAEVERVALAVASAGGGGGGFGGGGPAVATYEARVRLLELPEPVRVGLSADVEVTVEVVEDALLVPNQAIFGVPAAELEAAGVDLAAGEGEEPWATYPIGGREAVLVVYEAVDGALVPHPVEIGPSDATDTVIARGPAEGTPIVTGPPPALLSLGPGMAVTPAGGGPAEGTPAGGSGGSGGGGS